MWVWLVKKKRESGNGRHWEHSATVQSNVSTWARDSSPSKRDISSRNITTFNPHNWPLCYEKGREYLPLSPAFHCRLWHSILRASRDTPYATRHRIHISYNYSSNFLSLTGEIVVSTCLNLNWYIYFQLSYLYCMMALKHRLYVILYHMIH